MKRVMLIIRDGWGYSERHFGNAVHYAETPNDDYFKKTYTTSTIQTTGHAVGNPEGTQGGSEVGHYTIGAGRVIWQPFELINRSIADRSFFSNKNLLKAIDNCKKHNTNLHINGLFSDQGIHADYKHMHALLYLCKMNDFEKVFIHLTLDGRDVPERSSKKFLNNTLKLLDKIGVGKIATISGRYYSMDRDENWHRTRKAFEAMAFGSGFVANSATQAINDAYERGDKTDYYIQPTVIVDRFHKPISILGENDSFIWYNFRTDRSRQIAAMIGGNNYCPTELRNKLNIYLVCFSSYDSSWDFPVVFKQQKVRNNLGAVLSDNGKTQLRITESEKYAHVTFFFNSQIFEPFYGEDRMLVSSPKVASYDQLPEMSAMEITKKLLPEIGRYDFILVNYANPDLVGHSGNFDATVKACEVVDNEVGIIVRKAIKQGYVIFLMADHGNADHMLYDNGTPDPSHGYNPVLLTLINDEGYSIKNGKMSDIAPTILDVMNLPIPQEMDGESLIS